MDKNNEILNNSILELRRGSIVLSVLSQLSSPQYGYMLVQSLEEKGLSIDPGTLYPLLRRLEKQELLLSEWETTGTKPRKYYNITEKGRELFRMLCDEWNKMTVSVNNMINTSTNT